MNIVSTLASYSVYPLAAVAAAGVVGCITCRIHLKEYLPRFPAYDEVIYGEKTYVQICAQEGNYFTLRVLLALGVRGIDTPDNLGYAPLHYAVDNKDVSIVTALLEQGANPNIQNKIGDTPLHTLVKMELGPACSDEVLTVLMNTLIKSGANLELPNEKGLTPLHLAILKGKGGFVRALLNAGANPNAPVNGLGPLHLAVEMSNHDILRALLEAGADPNAPTHLGKISPLHLAATSNRFGSLLILLGAGADPNATSDENMVTPLHIAAAANHVHSMRALLNAGADPNARTREKESPLHSATLHNRSHNIPILIEAGAKVNATDHHGETSLHHAVSSFWIDSMKALIAGHADVNARNLSGDTPLHTLARTAREDFFHHKKTIFSTLIQSGADIRLLNNQGLNPQALAYLSRNKEVGRFLEELNDPDGFFSKVAYVPLPSLETSDSEDGED